MRILSIDPGRTTGLAKLAGDVLYTETIPINYVINEVAIGMWEEVVIEYYATAGRLSKYGLETIDMVGQVKGFCYARTIPCIVQSPMSRKPWIHTAEMMIGSKQHEVDALAHLLQWLERQGLSYPTTARSVNNKTTYKRDA